MKNLDQSITNSGNLDESMTNFLGSSDLKFKDLFSKEAIRGGLLYGPIGAVTEANKKLARAKQAADAAEGAQREIAAAELEAANMALAQAQAELDASKSAIVSNSNSGVLSKTSDTKPFPWLLVGGITFGVLALGVTAYFVFRKKK